MERNFWKEHLAAYGLLSVLFVVVYVYVFDSKLDMNGDNYGYLNYARSILEGKGYVSPYTPDLPATNWFPPGYSTLLAGLMALFGSNVVLFKIFNGLLYAASVFLLYAVMHRITKQKAFALTVAILLLLNSGLLRYASIIMSEIPYLFFSMLSVFAFVYWKPENESGVRFKQLITTPRFWVLLLSATAAFYFRTIGAALLISYVLYWLFHKAWKPVVAFVSGVGLLYLPWMLRNSAHGLKSRYLDTITVVNNWRPEEGHIQTVGGFIEKFWTNFQDTVLSGFVEVLFPYATIETPVILVGLLVFALILWGAWKTGKVGLFMVLYVLGNVGVFLLWHGGNGARYVWPLAPFLAFFFFNGVYQLWLMVVRSKSQKWVHSAVYVFLLLAFASFSSLEKEHMTANQPQHPAYRNYFQIAETLKKHADPSVMVICRKAEMFHYYSGTFTSMYVFDLDPKAVLRHMVQMNAQFVVLEQLGYGSTPRYLYPAIQAYPELFKMAVHLPNPDTYLFAFDLETARTMFH